MPGKVTTYKDVLKFIDECRGRGVLRFDGLGVHFELGPPPAFEGVKVAPIAYRSTTVSVDGFDVPADLLDHEAS